MAAARVTSHGTAALLFAVGPLGVLATLGTQAQAPAAPCRYEENCECRVPGITVRWKAASCMAREQTDDLEQPGVQACLARPDPESVRTLTTCARNEHWKRQLCAAVREKQDVDACVRDAAFIPRIVERGHGGAP